jgi:hypothetical protein
MKRANWLITLFILSFNASIAFAQTKDDIFNGSADITWLGIDFSQTKFIGSATQFKDAGEITSAEFRDKYIPGWNQLFLDEQKKYDVAKALKRAEVKYAMEVTEKANSSIKGNFFSNDPLDYKKLDEQKVATIVKGYDFQGKTGIGLMFIIDGMSKAKDEASGWITFVDMKTKKVLYTEYKTGKAGGFGFKNYWAKSFHNMLQATGKMKG